jgi:hypothetical protein
MAIHQPEKQILLLNYEGKFHEDFQEVHQEVNYSYNYKLERLFFLGQFMLQLLLFLS